MSDPTLEARAEPNLFELCLARRRKAKPQHDERASGEPNMFGLSRVVTEEGEVRGGRFSLEAQQAGKTQKQLRSNEK